MMDSALFYALCALAVLMVGISKGGFAGGGAIVGVPLLSLVISPAQAAGIILPLLLFMDVLAVWNYRGQWSRQLVLTLLPGLMIGIAIGTFAFAAIPPDGVRLLVGVIAAGYALRYWLRLGPGDNAPARRPSFFHGGIWGSVSGFTSTIAHAGAPPVAVYLLPQKLPRTTMQATSVLTFFILNWSKLPPYLFLDLLIWDNVKISLMMAPLVPIGIGLGVWLHKKVSDDTFYKVAYTLLLLTGGKLLWEGISGFAAQGGLALAL